MTIDLSTFVPFVQFVAAVGIALVGLAWIHALVRSL